jgi:hypothetical protein
MRTKIPMISNQFKPFSNNHVVQFLQCENPAPLPFRQEVLGGRYPQPPPAVYTAAGPLPIVGSPAALQSLVQSSFHCRDHRGSPSLLPEPTYSSLDYQPRGSSPSIALSPAGQLPPRVPRSGGVLGRAEGDSSKLLHKCRGSDLNRRLLDFQSKSPQSLLQNVAGSV